MHLPIFWINVRSWNYVGKGWGGQSISDSRRNRFSHGNCWDQDLCILTDYGGGSLFPLFHGSWSAYLSPCLPLYFSLLFVSLESLSDREIYVFFNIEFDGIQRWFLFKVNNRPVFITVRTFVKLNLSYMRNSIILSLCLKIFSLFQEFSHYSNSSSPFE